MHGAHSCLVPVNYFVASLFDHLQCHDKPTTHVRAADLRHLLLLLKFVLDNLFRERRSTIIMKEGQAGVLYLWIRLMVANKFVSWHKRFHHQSLENCFVTPILQRFPEMCRLSHHRQTGLWICSALPFHTRTRWGDWSWTQRRFTLSSTMGWRSPVKQTPSAQAVTYLKEGTSCGFRGREATKIRGLQFLCPWCSNISTMRRLSCFVKLCRLEWRMEIYVTNGKTMRAVRCVPTAGETQMEVNKTLTVQAMGRTWASEWISGSVQRYTGIWSIIWKVEVSTAMMHWGMKTFAGKLEQYYIISSLPDKVASFLYEYHDFRYRRLDLPFIPEDRSRFDIHAALKPEQVIHWNYSSY